MKKIGILLSCLVAIKANAQENMHPAPAQKNTVAIIHATVHVGNGDVINDGMVVFSNGKIVEVRATAPIADVVVVDAAGKHLYPGIIAANTNLGLLEVGAVRATADFAELGDVNPSIRSLVAYNTDSKVINTVRSNGILLAHIVPKGGTISGTSSVVQLDAWNWEDAAYKTDNGIHLNMPSLINLPAQFRRPGTENIDRIKQGLDRLEGIRAFFREARAYQQEATHLATNLKFEAVKGLFDKSKTLYVHCDLVKEMLLAIDLAEEFGCKLVLVGASDSWQIADALKQHQVGVILAEPHNLPSTDDDDVDQPYKTAAVLQRAGVLFTLCIDAGDGFWQQRNIAYEAGTTAAYGLTKEQALSAITLNAAKLLGIDQVTGSIEKGKDANLVISEGDILDMKTAKVTKAFIQGREIDLNNKQTQLYERYKYKYNL